MEMVLPVHFKAFFHPNITSHRLSEAQKKVDKMSVWSRKDKLVLSEVAAEISGTGTRIHVWGPRGKGNCWPHWEGYEGAEGTLKRRGHGSFQGVF